MIALDYRIEASLRRLSSTLPTLGGGGVIPPIRLAPALGEQLRVVDLMLIVADAGPPPFAKLPLASFVSLGQKPDAMLRPP